jgi:hypothetical protein
MDSSEGKRVVKNHLNILQENWGEFEKYFRYMYSTEAKQDIKSALAEYYSEDMFETIEYEDELYRTVAFLQASYKPSIPTDELQIDLTLNPTEAPHYEGLSRAVCEDVYRQSSLASEASRNVEEYLRTGCGYQITNIPTRPTDKFEFALTNYKTTISQQKQLYYELLDKLYAYNRLQSNNGNKTQSPESISVPLRDEVGQTFSMCTDVTQSERFLTLTVLPLFKTESSYLFPIVKYGEDAFRKPTWKSTLPETSFNYRRKPKDEFDLTYSIYEAVASQMFSHRPNLNSLFNHTAISELKKLHQENNIQLKTVGVATSSIDITHSLLTYMKIEDDSYLDSFVFDFYDDIDSFELVDITDSSQLKQVFADPEVLPQTKLVVSETLKDIQSE